jgi:glycine/D-amino acid oxidase-like deaminating enzyme
VNEYPYWLDTLPASAAANTDVPNPEPRIPNPDVVIVGAGYTGLSAARMLARAGAAVQVIDAQGIGWGASSRNGGQVITGLKVDAATLVARYGEPRARELFAAADASMARLADIVREERIDCDYARTGHFQAASKPAHFDAFRDEQALLARVFGRRVELIAKSDQRSEVGSDLYFGLLLDQESAALNPARYVHGLAAAASRAGASIAIGVRAIAVRRDNKRVVVSTSAGEISTQDVLFATNGYTDAAAPALRKRLVPVGSYIVATTPLSEEVADSILPTRRMAFDSKHFLHYFRLTPDRRLLFGGRAEFSQPDNASTRRAAAILRGDMERVFPQLAGVAIEYAWSGAVAFTRDQMPRAGMLDGLYYAGGYCGHGIAMATYLGELIGRRIAGEPIEHPLFDDEFAAIPMYSGTPWFLPVVGVYYQVKDWLQ